MLCGHRVNLLISIALLRRVERNGRTNQMSAPLFSRYTKLRCYGGQAANPLPTVIVQGGVKRWDDEQQIDLPVMISEQRACVILRNVKKLVNVNRPISRSTVQAGDLFVSSGGYC